MSQAVEVMLFTTCRDTSTISTLLGRDEDGNLGCGPAKGSFLAPFFPYFSWRELDVRDEEPGLWDLRSDGEMYEFGFWDDEDDGTIDQLYELIDGFFNKKTVSIPAVNTRVLTVERMGGGLSDKLENPQVYFKLRRYKFSTLALLGQYG